MKGLIYRGPGQMAYEEAADVRPAPGEIKIHPRAVGICGSDIHGYLGITGRRTPPMIMGHEFSGVVEELGDGVSGFRPGDRVTAYPMFFCEECSPCREGNVHLCVNRRFLGVLEVNGAMADSVSVPAKCCFKLADGVSFETASLMEPLAVAHRAVSRAGRERIAGKNVFLVGTGTIGLLALACAKSFNPERLIVSDLSDARLRLAERMGATRVINPSRGEAAKAVRELTGGLGADTAFEAVGASPTVQQAMSGLRQGGTAVWIGNNKPMIEVNMQEIVTRELTILGTYLYSFEEFKLVVDLLNSGKLDVSPIISKTAPMAEGPAMFAKMAKDPGDWIKVVLV
ncbi:MAG: galactitol-1-phosphate 5-dehydrogenase, partial [Planctomycetota bacterium]|nr:galactitol-1-phosphate 5-dehydrogenase [Planctomycetota bacterium]